LIEVEGDGCGDADDREEGVGASIAAGRDSPPILEPDEQVLDFVSLAVEGLVIVERGFAAAGWRNAWRYASGFKSIAEPVAVTASGGDQG